LGHKEQLKLTRNLSAVIQCHQTIAKWLCQARTRINSGFFLNPLPSGKARQNYLTLIALQALLFKGFDQQHLYLARNLPQFKWFFGLFTLIV